MGGHRVWRREHRGWGVRWASRYDLQLSFSPTLTPAHSDPFSPHLCPRPTRPLPAAGPLPHRFGSLSRAARLPGSSHRPLSPSAYCPLPHLRGGLDAGRGIRSPRNLAGIPRSRPPSRRMPHAPRLRPNGRCARRHLRCAAGSHTGSLPRVRDPDHIPRGWVVGIARSSALRWRVWFWRHVARDTLLCCVLQGGWSARRAVRPSCSRGCDADRPRG